MTSINKGFLFGACVILAACAHHDADKTTRLNDSGDIRVADLRSSKANGLLTVAASLQNTSSSTKSVQYRFKWVDAGGFESGDEGWTSQVIYPNQTVQIRGVSPAPSVADFHVELSQ